MSDPLQLVLVGLGRMGSVHASAIAALASIEVVAVADPSEDARAAAALLFPRARLLAKPAAALEADRIGVPLYLRLAQWDAIHPHR